MKKIIKKHKKLTAFFIIVLLLSIFLYWQNNSIEISKFEYSNPKIPSDFSGFRIVHISDLHNKMFGKNQESLLEKIESLSPDIIVVTGDLIDRRRFDLEKAMIFIDGAVNIAPVYYVSGNHEAWSGKYSQIKDQLLTSGVIILDDSFVEIKKGEAMIKLFGLRDPGFYNSRDANDINEKLEAIIGNWSNEEDFKILLSHRPELFSSYVISNIDLIFAGHAHGGQFRLPFIGPIFAPNQGFFPKLTSGSHNSQSSTMFISRGLGNSIIPIRLFNRPEVLVVTLNK